MSTGFGRDTWAGDQLVTGRYADGVTGLSLALYRRLITPRGTLQGLDDDADEGDESNYGFDVAGHLGAVGVDAAEVTLPAMIRGELLKDDRVTDVSVGIARADDGVGTTFTISVRVTPASDDEDFEFTMGVSELSASLLGVST